MQQNINSFITKLYQITAKLIDLIEIDLHELENTNSLSKKNIADVLSKIVCLIVNLKKIHIDKEDNQDLISLEDKKIIDHFLNQLKK